MTRRDTQLNNVQVTAYLLDRLRKSKPIFYPNFAMLGATRKMISNKWKSVKVSITLSFLHKLIKFPHLVKAGHKRDLLWQFSNTVLQEQELQM